MNSSLPASAAVLLDFIASFESGGGYDVIIGNHQNQLPKKITTMTLDELSVYQRHWAAVYKSSAAGRYQIMSYTLEGLKSELCLSGEDIFSADLQDRLGFKLLQRRQFARFISGAISLESFGLELAKEWASLPVLAAVQRRYRVVQRGETYYAGDGLNKAGVSPEHVEAILRRALALVHDPLVLAKKPEIPMPSPTPASTTPLPNQDPKPWYLSKGIIGGLIAIATPIITVLTHGAIHPDPAGTTELVMKIIEVAGPVIGGLLAVWGRTTATQPIGSKQQPTPDMSGGLAPIQSMMNLPLGTIIDELPQIVSMLQNIGQIFGGASGPSVPDVVKDTTSPIVPRAKAINGASTVLPKDLQAAGGPDFQSLAADLVTKMSELGPLLANLSPQTQPRPRTKPAPVT